MRFLRHLMAVTALCAALIHPCTARGQDTTARVALGSKASTLGIGVEAATSVASRSNIRGGLNLFTYERTVDRDGVTYDGSLKLRSVQVNFDQYLLGGFHVSPGLLLYNGNRAEGSASVPSGRSFSLGDVTYFSYPSDPVKGSATVKLGTTAPMLLLGFGNPIPRSRRRFGINFDFGVVFQGSPDVTLRFTGTACALPFAGCVNAATDPNVLRNIQAQQDKASNDLKAAKYYPVLSLAFSWKL
jgi:hypothetical protein